MDQKSIFLGGEGDNYFARRTRTTYRSDVDPVVDMIVESGRSPGRTLEVGCSDSFRLGELRKRFGGVYHGVDPSPQAIASGLEMFPEFDLRVGSADALPWPDASFDTLVFGFCLSLCDRNDLFVIAAEADRVLADGGAVVIHDFHPPYPYRNRYAHTEGVFSYKLDYARLFLWNPAYHLVKMSLVSLEHVRRLEHGDDMTSVQLLIKDMNGAYPDRHR